MRSITVGGPLAELSVRLLRAQEQVAALQTTARHWELVAAQSGARLEAAQRAAEEHHTRAEQLASQLAPLEQRAAAAEKERDEAVGHTEGAKAAASAREAELLAKVEELSKTNQSLETELQEARRVRQVASDRLAKARERLGLSDREARQFVQELDEARADAAAAKRERDRLASDLAALRAHCESRGAHVMVLLESNHRQLETISALRQEVAALQAERFMKGSALGAAAHSAAAAAEPTATGKRTGKAATAPPRPAWQRTTYAAAAKGAEKQAPGSGKAATGGRDGAAAVAAAAAAAKEARRAAVASAQALRCRGKGSAGERSSPDCCSAAPTIEAADVVAFAESDSNGKDQEEV